MHTEFPAKTRAQARRLRGGLLILLLIAFALAGCGRGRAEPTPTPTPVPTATPIPTATPVPAGDDAANDSADAASAATPTVVIPAGFTVRNDTRLGYSFALPSGWTDIDLRSPRFRGMVDSIGLGDQVAPMLDFLDTQGGQAVGLVAMTDLAGMIFGGLPTVVNVSVLDLPGASADDVAARLQQLLSSGVLPGDVTVSPPTVTTVNNLPAVQATATGSMASLGVDARIFAQVTGLLANDKVYLLSLVTDEAKRGDKEAEFAQIIGSFRPE